MINRILTTIGAGRLIGVALISVVIIGALVAVPLLASANDGEDEPDSIEDLAANVRLLGALERLTDGTFFDDDATSSGFAFGGGSDEIMIAGTYDESGGGASFRFEMAFGEGAGIRFGADLIETTAELTGTDAADVAAALEEDQTLAEYAAAHGISEDELLDALLSEAEEQIAEALAEGDLTEEQAERIRTELSEHLSDLINGAGPFGGFGFDGPNGPGEFPFAGGVGRHFALGFDPVETVAELTGAEIEEIFTALDEGQTPAEFAAEYGVSEDELVAAIMAGVQESVAEAVAAGDLTQADADEILAHLEERARAVVNGEGFGFHHRVVPGEGSGFGPFGGSFMPGECDDDDSEDGGAPEGASTSDQI